MMAPPEDPNRPLILCDVDEVVLMFVHPFEEFLVRQGLRLVKRSYALSGNIIEEATGEAISGERTGDLVQGFFAAESHRQPSIPGAAEALAELADHADIRFLTNIPGDFLDTRSQRLTDHGMPYPVHVNSGPKGRVAAELAAGYVGAVHFLDDIGSNLVSVRQHIPHARLIYFINDPKFFALAPPVDEADVKTKNWTEAKRYILASLSGEHDGT
ncbi:MAG: hypothetical protein AAGL24_05580 [Pseudomonadota bacterium]